MGNHSVCPCLGSRDPNEKEILQKENSLMLHNFTILQIKDCFFYKNQQDTITYANVLKGMQQLTQTWVGANNLYKEQETDAKKILKALLKGIIDGEAAEKIEDNKFKFKPLMIMLILLSRNNSKDRIQGILQLEGKEKFTPDELTKELGLIFKTVCDCTLQMIISDMEESKKKVEIKKYALFQKNIDEAVKDQVSKIFNGSKEKTPVELGLMFYQFIPTTEYDAASTIGIRKIIKDHTKPEELAAIELEGQPKKEEPKQGETSKPGEPEKDKKLDKKADDVKSDAKPDVEPNAAKA